MITTTSFSPPIKVPFQATSMMPCVFLQPGQRMSVQIPFVERNPAWEQRIPGCIRTGVMRLYLRVRPRRVWVYKGELVNNG